MTDSSLKRSPLSEVVTAEAVWLSAVAPHHREPPHPPTPLPTRLLAPGEYPPTVQSQSEQKWVLFVAGQGRRACLYQPPGHPAGETSGSGFLRVSQDSFELCFRPLTLLSSGLDFYLHPVSA